MKKTVTNFGEGIGIMTQNEKLINIAGLVYVLRDLCEDADFDRELKMRVRNFGTYLDGKVKILMSNDPEVWEQYADLIDHFNGVIGDSSIETIASIAHIAQTIAKHADFDRELHVRLKNFYVQIKPHIVSEDKFLDSVLNIDANLVRESE